MAETRDISLRETVIEMPGMQITASANPTSLLTSPQPTSALDEDVLRTVQALQSGGLCGANWKKGEAFVG